MSKKFEDLPLQPVLIDNLRELKFDSMTPIQAGSLPVVLAGKDVIAQAKTGSGKTAAFGLGILNSLDLTSSWPQSLILCPTRELAEQVAKELRRLARTLNNVKVLTLCGGVAEFHQQRSLTHGAHVVVGTPGRVLRLLTKKHLHVNKLTKLVLDEADRMLDMGFYDDIMNIVSFLPEQRQSLLFSATYPDEIRDLSKHIQTEAVEVKVDVEHQPNQINQRFYQVKGDEDKNEALLQVLGRYRPERSIVFCKTKIATDAVAKLLCKRGASAGCIHGDLEQHERTAVLTKFSNRSLSVLVATDVAARGLDIQDLEAVINYDLPSDPEVYVHRIGRTGRAGKTGLAFSFFVPGKKFKLENIEELTGEKCKVEDLSELPIVRRCELTAPMKTMYISGGKRDKLRPSDILGALVGEAKIDPKHVGNISILTVLSYVAINSESIDQAVEKLSNGKIKKKKFNVGLA